MTPAWAQRQAELVSDCIVSPDIFDHIECSPLETEQPIDFEGEVGKL